MRWSRTFKFKTKLEAAEFIKFLGSKAVLRWMPEDEYLSVRVTCDEEERAAYDEVAKNHNGEPATEWQDKYI